MAVVRKGWQIDVIRLFFLWAIKKESGLPLSQNAK
jgi:hypothetical protein